ncbi:hypothetical protein [Megamonas funiformis]|uniref:hypothetical protein n=1 Tax=Megamonas funiformis TaxID=437897 RepID=UPI0029436AAA|nr:hypothetical protein [Megamonas funiformis]
MSFFKIIKDKIKKFFNKSDDANTDEILDLKDFSNINTDEEVIGFKENDEYIPKMDYIDKEYPIGTKPNNRISPKRRYITLKEAEKLVKR